MKDEEKNAAPPRCRDYRLSKVLRARIIAHSVPAKRRSRV
jgi:hypothetical protein